MTEIKKQNMMVDKPVILTLLLTYNCNLKCPFCGQNDIRRQKNFNESMQLSLEQVNKILDDARVAGIRNVNLWGGEPLLHPQIFDIIRAVKKRYMRCFMVTNGVLLEKYAQEIVDSRLDFLQISVDAPGEEHDLVRNHRGLFKKIEAGIKAVNEKKRIFPFISASTVLLPDNLDKLEAIADADFSIGFGTSFFQLLMSYPEDVIQAYKERLVKDYGFKYEDFRVIDNFKGEGLTLAEYEDGVAQCAAIKNKYGDKVTFPNAMNDVSYYKYYAQTSGPVPEDVVKGCWSINYKINIQPNGDVVTCPDFPDFVIGNVFEQSILEIWNSPVRKKFLNDFNNGNPLPICYRCCQLWDKEEHGSWGGVG